MSKIASLLFLLLITTQIRAQLYSENFDSYSVGSYLGVQSATWRTWTLTGEGTNEDVKITDDESLSNFNSIFLEGDFLNNDPQNIVLDLNQIYSNGIFSFQSAFLVPFGHSGKFNFQGNSVLGSLKSLEVELKSGVITFTSAGKKVLDCSYAYDTWFTLEIIANLSTQVWETKINGISEGKWINPINTISYVNFHPTVNDLYYLDDIYVDHNSYVPSNLNATAANLKKGGGELATLTAHPSLLVVNTGLSPITSLELQLEYMGNMQIQPVSNVNIAVNSSLEIPLPSVVFASISGFVKANINMVNGSTDDIPTDNSSQLFIEPTIPAFGKRVVTEERTGTWCEFCPLGHYYMEQMKHDYDPFWVGISIHNADPMQDTYYNQSYPTSGFPWSFTDREFSTPVAGMEKNFLQQIQIAPTALISIGGLYDSITRKLDISGTFDFIANANSNFKAVFVLTEDGVTGLSSGYQQNNAYAGGGLGPMGGFELLPDPVPANLMTYDHVARTIQPSFNGFTGSFPTTVNPGAVHTVNHSLVIPNSWDKNKINVIVMLTDPLGRIDNAGSAKIAEAVSNGYIMGTSTSGLSLAEIHPIDETFKMYPNPATTNVVLTFNLKQESNVAVRILDMAGKEIAERAYGAMNESCNINYSTSNLKAGVYLVEVLINGERFNRRLVIE